MAAGWNQKERKEQTGRDTETKTCTDKIKNRSQALILKSVRYEKEQIFIRLYYYANRMTVKMHPEHCVSSD